MDSGGFGRSRGHTRIRPTRAAPEGHRRVRRRWEMPLAILLPLGHGRTREFRIGNGCPGWPAVSGAA